MSMSQQSYDEWWVAQNAIRQDENISVKGIKLFVRRDVFSPSPKLTYSSSFLIKNIPDVAGSRILDMGTGSGILAIYAILYGAKSVTAVDIDRHALHNAQINIDKNCPNGKIILRQSDLFKNVKGQFNFIFANLPICSRAWKGISNKGMMVLYDRLLAEYGFYLFDDGKLFLTFASFGNMDWLLKQMKKRKIIYRMQKARKFDTEWFVFELKK